MNTMILYSTFYFTSYFNKMNYSDSKKYPDRYSLLLFTSRHTSSYSDWLRITMLFGIFLIDKGYKIKLKINIVFFCSFL